MGNSTDLEALQQLAQPGSTEEAGEIAYGMRVEQDSFNIAKVFLLDCRAKAHRSPPWELGPFAPLKFSKSELFPASHFPPPPATKTFPHRHFLLENRSGLLLCGLLRAFEGICGLLRTYRESVISICIYQKLS